MPAPARLFPPAPKPAKAVVRPAPRPVRVASGKAARDPRFMRVVDKLQRTTARTLEHPSPQSKVAEAQAAAKGPANEQLVQGQAGKVDELKEVKTEKKEDNSFLALLRAEIAKVMPKTLGETDHFMEGGAQEQMKSAVGGNVKGQKDATAAPMEQAAAQPPAPGGETKTVTPIAQEPAPAAPPIDAAAGMPAPKSAEEVSLDKSKQDVDQKLKDNKVTPEQLQKANDPRFSAVLDAKKKVDTQATRAPASYRAREQQTLGKATSSARSSERQGLGGLLGVKSRAQNSVKSKQELAKAADEQARKSFADDIAAIYQRTEAAVKAKLDALEPEVMTLFDQRANAAIEHMKSFVSGRLLDYKLERYLTKPLGAALWIKDQFVGLPDEVNAFYEEGRQQFFSEMDGVLIEVSNLVEKRLAQARAEVDKGQQAIKARVAQLPTHLRAEGAAKAQELSGQFDQLRQSIEDKKQDLAQSLAQKYKEASDKANAALDELKKENEGLVKGFVEQLGEILKILEEFRVRVVSLFRKAAGAVEKIVADPIAFLGNIVAAIRQGIARFVGNVWTHIKRGFMTWLFGELTKAGVEIPSDLSLPSILKLVLGVLGLTWANIRPKIVKKIGERAVTILEKVVEILQKLFTSGPAALWEEIKGFLGNLKQMVIDAILDWVVTRIVTQAITKIVSMFNPAGAIIQAIMMIYQVGSWLAANIGRLLDFVESIVNSVDAIASGNVGGAAAWIEQALGRMVPILIGFLASLLGLGGISAKVKSFIQKVQAAVGRAVDFVIDKVFNFVKKLIGKVTGKDKAKAKDKDKDKKTDKDAGDPNTRLTAAVTAAEAAVAQDPFLENIAGQVASIKAAHGLKSLTIKKTSEETVHIDAEVNPHKGKDHRLSNRERLENCVGSRKHGKKVKLIGHGDPKVAKRRAQEKLKQLRAFVDQLMPQIEPLEAQLRQIEAQAVAAHVPRDKIKTLLEPVRAQLKPLKDKLTGYENDIKGIEHEEKVASSERSILRNINVQCVRCGQRVTELDQVADKKVILEAKASAKAIDVDKILVQQKAIKQLFGKTAKLVLALPNDLEVVKAAQKKFAERGVPMPEVKLY